MKTEIWNGHEIRFVEKDSEWWAVLADLCKPLGLEPKLTRRRLDEGVLSKHLLPDSRGVNQNYLIVNEEGIYEVFASSRKRAAKEFRKFVFKVIKKLRQSIGLEGFEVFRMLDKEHQKEAMQKLRDSLKPNGKVNYIKANTIANKATSNKHGFDKMIKKADMTPGMLRDREAILDDVVELMIVKEKYELNDLKIAEEIYRRWEA